MEQNERLETKKRLEQMERLEKSSNWSKRRDLFKMGVGGAKGARRKKSDWSKRSDCLKERLKQGAVGAKGAIGAKE